MQRTKITGTLPIAIHLVVEQQPLKLNQVVMTQLSAIESIQAVQPDQYIAIGELAHMTKLLDDKGNEYQLSYEQLAHTSRKNFDYLKNLRDDLDAKEIAENSETEQDSSEH
ncbi:hypothetical protein WCE14_00625 [Acinetobacter schindleri]|uniref:hypothetical protein n=1 Tax=Acinetobacter schindleri TaxID=108981 RepID=UPI0034D5B741